MNATAGICTSKVIMIDPDKCTGCGLCEMVCSLKHEGECNPTLSRIKIVKGALFISVPVTCQQCGTPLCREVCPLDAIHRDSETGAYLVDAERCVGCRLCVIACPLGAIEIHPYEHLAMNCDLCGGDPMCVKFCLPEALTYVSEEKIGFARKREAIEKLSRSLELITGELESAR